MLFPQRFMPFYYEADKGKDGDPPEKGDDNSPGQDPEDNFDKDRAMATISKLREFEKEAKALKKRVADYEAAEQARKEAEMSDAEKTQARLDQLEAEAQAAKAERDQAKAQAAETLMRTAVLMAAASFHDPAEAWMFVDRSKLEIDEAGNVTGAEKAVEAVAKAKPHLLKAQSKTLGTPGGKPRDARKTNDNNANDAKPLVHM